MSILSNKNPASENTFLMTFTMLPKVSFLLQDVDLPGVGFSQSADFHTPRKVLPMPGDTVTYDDLEISFLVDENLENWEELHKWFRGIGNPYTADERENFVQVAQHPSVKPLPVKNIGSVMSDGTLTILNSNNRPVLAIKYLDCWPLRVSGLKYTTKIDSVKYLFATATFKYSIYLPERVT